MVFKALLKRSRRASKEDEAEGAVSAAEGEEVDSPPGKTGDKEKCQLCCAHIKGNPSRHIATFHLKQHLYTCPLCVYGYGSRESVAGHIRKMHPLEVDKQPVCHVEELSAEIQRLQAICFPKRRTTLCRPLNAVRAMCRLCKFEVNCTKRHIHVLYHHLKKKGMFECPLCGYSSSAIYDAVKVHIKSHHKEEHGKVHPISHEKRHEKEIFDLGKQCFPEWRPSSDGKKKTHTRKEDHEAEKKGEAEEEKLPSGSKSDGEEAPREGASGTPAIKTKSKGKEPAAGEEEEEEMEDGEGTSKGGH